MDIYVSSDTASPSKVSLVSTLPTVVTTEEIVG